MIPGEFTMLAKSLITLEGSISLVFLSLSIVIAGTIVGLSLTDVEGSNFITVTKQTLRGSLILAVITFVALIIAIFRSKRIFNEN